MGTYLTRRITFDAAHRYWRADWNDDENRRVFGSWATPKFHGHEYVCVVTVTGDVDRLVPTCENLARFIAECVQRALGNSATVTAVRIAEDETISATHRPDDGDTHGR